MEGQQKKNTIFKVTMILIGKDCEVDKIMRFYTETKMFEEI